MRKAFYRLCLFFQLLSPRRLLLKRRLSFRTKKTPFLFCKWSFRGKGNHISAEDCTFYRCTFRCLGSNNRFVFAPGGSYHRVFFSVDGDNNVIMIGKGARIVGPSSSVDCAGGKSITIGDGFLAAQSTLIRNCDYHALIDASGKTINGCEDVSIGEHVWLCERAAVLKSGGIGNNSVVAFGSVITKDFSSFDSVILGGVPARIVKEGVSWR